jgi:serine protease inhibitor
MVLRKIFVPLMILLMALPFVAGCGGQPPQTEPAENDVKSYILRTESPGFAFGLFHGVASEDYSGNIVLSPVSAKLALAMAYNGASGRTAEAMARVLDLEGMSLEEANEQLHNLMTSLEQADPSVLVEIADSLWADEGYEFKEDFIQRCRDLYAAEVASLDLQDPGTAERINSWVSEQTHDKIDRIVDAIDPAVVLMLINAVYFNGKWSAPFDPSLTADGDFKLWDGGTISVPFMHRSGEFSYYEDDDFQAVSLPYGEKGDGRLSMYVILPSEGRDYGEFLGGLNDADWENLMGRFQNREGELALPRFKAEYEKVLNGALETMGMGPAFEGGFEGMADGGEENLFISKVLQKTYIDVNEEGTEAAAVTSAEVQLTAMPADSPFTMSVDRPFFFAIRDNQTGALLFLGSIVDPS